MPLSSWSARRLLSRRSSQSQFAKKAFDTYVAETSKLSDICVGTAREAYKPVEKAGTVRAPRGLGYFYQLAAGCTACASRRW
jgi:hypothetical protein